MFTNYITTACLHRPFLPNAGLGFPFRLCSLLLTFYTFYYQPINIMSDASGSMFGGIYSRSILYEPIPSRTFVDTGHSAPPTTEMWPWRGKENAQTFVNQFVGLHSSSLFIFSTALYSNNIFTQISIKILIKRFRKHFLANH